MSMAEIMKLISGSKKYIISNAKPKFLDDCTWIDVNSLSASCRKEVFSPVQKKKLQLLEPLDLPVTSMTLNCPIEGKKISFAVHYFYINGWIINSATIHYILSHDIALPDQLVEAIVAL